jgi:1-deoxy-D-xylulose-5-phosphate synthase
LPSAIFYLQTEMLVAATALQVGRGIVRRQGKDVCLLAYGSSVNEAMVAAELLSRAGVSATVVDARFCKPLDTDLIRRCAREHAAMISIEEGSIGGFAAHVMQFLALDGLLDGGLKFRPMTLPDRFIDHGRCVDVCNRVTKRCCIVHLATYCSLQLNSDVS